ncbi:MAG: YkgJ family cysteine cluster protein, partial [Bryobacteraceae bacterium]|jgi:Fe-S-cluster containining protein
MRGDDALIQIVDRALAETARKSGPWLLCRPGCAECCMGEFAITQLDANRLRRGLAELEAREPERAARVRQRAREAIARHPVFADEEPCAALDPETGTCDLYAARPITCRTFGPPARVGSEAVGVCELCFQGASDAEIAACEVEFDPEGLESELLDKLAEEAGLRSETTVAQALGTTVK